MSGIQIEMDGINTVLAKIGTLDSVEARRARTQAMYKQALVTLTKAISYTPVATGALRNSGQVNIEGNDVVISFGGPAAPYAIYVHEDLYAAHPVGQSKFLERAVMEDADAFVRAMNIKD